MPVSQMHTAGACARVGARTLNQEAAIAAAYENRPIVLDEFVPQLSLAVPLGGFCALLVAMTVKHFVADFVLQTNWIAHGKDRKEGWFAPLAVHVLCHACLTLCIALVVAPRLWWLALVDLVIHTMIDRSKSLMVNRWGWGTNKLQFWWLLGFDQLLHQITNVALVAAFFLF